MKEIEVFKKAAADPLAYASEWKRKSGKKIIGSLCTYSPEELVYAAGALPYRIFGSTEDLTHADKHLQSYCCSLARGSLEDALSGRLSFLDGTIFPHTCDSIQRLSDIWRLNGKFAMHFDVIYPVKMDTESAKKYNADVIKKFKKDLEKALNISISDADLKKSIELFNSIRAEIKKLYLAISAKPGCIPGGDMASVLKASMIMDRDELLISLKALNTAVKEKSGPGSAAKRIIISGGICNHPDIYSTLENAGGAVVWDDLCTGTRYFEGEIRTSGDPLEAIASRYSERVVCPAKHHGNESRGENLLKICREHRADGVIFLFLKFCDPQSFDYPYMKAFLDKEGIPGMRIEIEEQLPPEGQLRTRFETFIQLLK